MSSLHPAHPRQSRKFQIEGGGVGEDAAWSAEGSTAGFTIDTGTGMITGVMPVQGDVYPNPLTSDLILDQATGILSGSITRDDAGETHRITVHARNDFGEDTKSIELLAAVTTRVRCGPAIVTRRGRRKKETTHGRPRASDGACHNSVMCDTHF